MSAFGMLRKVGQLLCQKQYDHKTKTLTGERHPIGMFSADMMNPCVVPSLVKINNRKSLKNCMVCGFLRLQIRATGAIPTKI